MLDTQRRYFLHRTSGIAHEFNDLLTPIMGYSILILEKLPPEDIGSYDNALEIYNASQKAKKIIARLFQMVLNLVLNSFEALSAQGGTVRITTSADERYISLRVADNGPGIPEELKSRVFDPFFTTKGSSKGIGLGLSIVQQIVTDHGGSITVLCGDSGLADGPVSGVVEAIEDRPHPSGGACPAAVHRALKEGAK